MGDHLLKYGAPHDFRRPINLSAEVLAWKTKAEAEKNRADRAEEKLRTLEQEKMSSKKEEYFVIRSGEDGPSVHRFNRQELLARLDESYWGPVAILETLPCLESAVNALVVIKGTIVRPTAKTTVVKHEVE